MQQTNRLSLDKPQTTATFRKINSTDERVRQLARALIEGQEYSMIPAVQGGVNSNSAAGAIASKADGGPSDVKNNTPEPGSGQSSRIAFRKIYISIPRPPNVHE